MDKDAEMAIRNEDSSPFCSKPKVVLTEELNCIRQFQSGTKSQIYIWLLIEEWLTWQVRSVLPVGGNPLIASYQTFVTSNIQTHVSAFDF